MIKNLKMSIQCHSWERGTRLRNSHCPVTGVPLCGRTRAIDQATKLTLSQNSALVTLISLWLLHKQAGFFLEISILPAMFPFLFISQVLEGTQLKTFTYFFPCLSSRMQRQALECPLGERLSSRTQTVSNAHLASQNEVFTLISN